MTRVNLLRSAPDRRASGGSIGGRRAALACGLLVTLTICGLALWAFRLNAEATRLDREVARARQELLRLRSVVEQTDALRVSVQHLQRQADHLAQLRTVQRAHLGVLGEISRSLPDDSWLTAITEEAPDAIRIEGRAAALSSLFAFVDRLQASSAFTGRVEVLDSRTGAPVADGDLAAFTVKAFLRAFRPAAGPSTIPDTPRVVARAP